LGIDKVSVSTENQKIETSIESLRRDQTQIAKETVAAEEALQSHIVVDPTELEGLQGIGFCIINYQIFSTDLFLAMDGRFMRAMNQRLPLRMIVPCSSSLTRLKGLLLSRSLYFQ
jgi:hypothetical protein